MASHDFDIGILGGGAAGLTVAAGASQLGAKALLIEQEKELGGDCLHFGCVPSKTLIKIARVRRLMGKAEEFGLSPVESGPVDYQKVVARIREVISAIQLHDSVERFCRLGVKVEFGEPSLVDEHMVRLNGSVFSAKNWVIATGSSPAIPSVPGLEKTPYITNKEIFSLEHLPESMIVLGGGPIAIEMAQAFQRLGTRVFVIQRSAQILSKEDKDMADVLMEVLSQEGVKFYLNTSVLGAKDLGGEREVALKTAGGQIVNLRAQTILVALGREANLRGIGLEGLGIPFSQKGLELDSRLRTRHKHIYAAGDVTGEYQFTHAAGYEGSIVVGNAILRLPRKANYKWMPWCTYTDPELAGIGMSEKMAQEAGVEYTVWKEEFRANDRSLAEGETVGKVKMLLSPKGRPLGVQILGLHAGELLNEWVAILNGGVRLSSVASAVHPYPTLGEISKRVVGNVYARKLYSDTVKKVLRFFFDLKGRACQVD